METVFGHARLCYADDERAFFTTRDPISATPAGDWGRTLDQAFSPREWRSERDGPRYELVEVRWYGPWQDRLTADQQEGRPSPKVYTLNDEQQAWLLPEAWAKGLPALHAGLSLDAFLDRFKGFGRVYLAEASVLEERREERPVPWIGARIELFDGAIYPVLGLTQDRRPIIHREGFAHPHPAGSFRAVWSDTGVCLWRRPDSEAESGLRSDT